MRDDAERERMKAELQQEFEIEINDDRHLFARWLRRVLPLCEMRFTDLRKLLGADRPTFNMWLKDIPNSGRVLVPTDDECKMIAEVVDVPSAFVLRLAARTRAAEDDIVVTDRPRFVRRPREKEVGRNA